MENHPVVRSTACGSAAARCQDNSLRDYRPSQTERQANAFFMSCPVARPDLLDCRLENPQTARREPELGRIGIMRLRHNPPTCPTAKILHFSERAKKKEKNVCKRWLGQNVRCHVNEWYEGDQVCYCASSSHEWYAGGCQVCPMRFICARMVRRGRRTSYARANLHCPKASAQPSGGTSPPTYQIKRKL